MNYSYLASPIGDLLVAGEQGALCEIRFPREGRALPNADWEETEVGLLPALDQLLEYFAGKRQDFDLLLRPQGTRFQRSVWDQLKLIPFGQTISYGELAKRIGNPKASRAVGAANGKNPIPIIVPCHRVIGGNGRLTGFGGGLPLKARLLEIEGVRMHA